ncbi:MAG: hypothetical protein ACYDDF_02960 [Thermoplasmatota archaeon]
MAQVLVPFHCGHCGAANAVHLLTIAREGSTRCAGCGRRLTTQEVTVSIGRARGAREAAIQS